MSEASFAVRGLELHSLYAWDYDSIIRVMDFLQRHDMNTLVLHRNDFIDLIIYPGLYFGNENRPYESIFERYSEIFRKLYKYTPTRRSGPYQRRAFLKRVLEQARRRGIQVFIENKELYFPEIILEFYPHLVKEGHICASDPFWWEFTREKYAEFFEEFPEISGIITAPATGESKVSINSNRCTCPRCRKMSKQEWFDTLLRTMYEPIHNAGKKLIVRDFVFDSKSHGEIASVMEALPEDVIISLKNTPHDYFPTFPENARIGHVGPHEQWIEFDTMGQYFGWGIGMADLLEDYRWRLKSAREKGASGAVFRLDWESLDGAIPFKTHNCINVYAAAALTRNVDTDATDVYQTFLEENGWLVPETSQAQRREAARWYETFSSKTWPVTAKTPFVNGCVFSDSSVIPISLEHAFWLGEEKNSLKDWQHDKKEVLSPVQASVQFALAEKQQALQGADELVSLAKQPCRSLLAEKRQLLLRRAEVNRMYVRLYKLLTEALMQTRYALYTQEPRDSAFYAQTLEGAKRAVEELKQMETELRDFGRETDERPHIVYTLLDPDRVRCLWKDLEKRMKELSEP